MNRWAEVDLTQLGPQTSHSAHRRREIVLEIGRNAQAEFLASAKRSPRSRCPDQALRRHAPDVEAVASHQMSLDQRDPVRPARRQ